MLERITMHFRPDERPFIQRVEELLERTREQNRFGLTSFLNPRQCHILNVIARTYGDLNVAVFGGTEFAERKRAVIAPGFLEPELADAELAVIRVSLKKPVESLTHGDYLGAFLGAGIQRDKVGDLYVRPDGCDAIVTQDLVPFWLQSIPSVGRYPVDVEEVPLSQLLAQPPTFEERIVTVPSLRLDAVASEGFRLSRSKAAEKIRAGLCQLNWQLVTHVSEEVMEGDVISLRGSGRIRVLEVGAVSKKGRQFLRLGKYI
jgi:RNA-binding protein YlmH